MKSSHWGCHITRLSEWFGELACFGQDVVTCGLALVSLASGDAWHYSPCDLALSASSRLAEESLVSLLPSLSSKPPDSRHIQSNPSLFI